MEPREKEQLERKSPEGVEEDYPHHKEHPDAPKEAIIEENSKGGGQVLKWLIPLLVVILLLIYLFMK